MTPETNNREALPCPANARPAPLSRTDSARLGGEAGARIRSGDYDNRDALTNAISIGINGGAGQPPRRPGLRQFCRARRTGLDDHRPVRNNEVTYFTPNFSLATVTSASWAILSGTSAGIEGTLVASGDNAATHRRSRRSATARTSSRSSKITRRACRHGGGTLLAGDRAGRRQRHHRRPVVPRDDQRRQRRRPPGGERRQLVRREHPARRPGWPGLRADGPDPRGGRRDPDDGRLLDGRHRDDGDGGGSRALSLVLALLGGLGGAACLRRRARGRVA